VLKISIFPLNFSWTWCVVFLAETVVQCSAQRVRDIQLQYCCGSSLSFPSNATRGSCVLDATDAGHATVRTSILAFVALRGWKRGLTLLGVGRCSGVTAFDEQGLTTTSRDYIDKEY